MLADLGERSGDIALQCSETAGFLGALNRRIQGDSARLVDLQANMDTLAASHGESVAAAQELRVTAQRAGRIIAEGHDVITLSIDELTGLVEHVTGLEGHLRQFLSVIEAVGGVSVLPQPVSSVAELQKVASVLRGTSIHIVFRDCNSSGNRPRRSRSVPQQLSSGVED